MKDPADRFLRLSLRAFGPAIVAAVLLVLASCPGSLYDVPGLVSNEGVDWRDEVIYKIVTDRFADGSSANNYNVNLNSPSSYHGGDWQGVIDQIPYLQSLGVTAVCISPVVKNVEEVDGIASYDGYWTQDFLSCNPHFGDLGKLREMVDVCHANGIKVILDIVCTHVGQLFYYDINLNGSPDILRSGSTSDPWDTATSPPEGTLSEYDPPYYAPQVPVKIGSSIFGEAPVTFFNLPDVNRMPPQPAQFQDPQWYHRRGAVTDWAVSEQVQYGDYPGGPKDLATERQDVRDALVDVFSYWIEQVDIDGFSIVRVKNVETSFWSSFCRDIRSSADARGKKNFIIFGEIWDGDDTTLGSYCGTDMFDSVLYFSSKYTVIEGVITNGANSAATNIEDLLVTDRQNNYGGTPQTGGIGIAPRDCLINFIDNHLLSRFLNDVSASVRNLALGYIFTIPGIPYIYYGTEQGYTGGGDPANREDLWDSGYDTANTHFQAVRQWTALRSELAPLRRGDFSVRWASSRTGDSDNDVGIFAFVRSYGGESVLVIMNMHPTKTSSTSYGGGEMDLTPYFNTFDILQDLIDPAFTYTVQDGTEDISVPPLSIRVLTLQ